MGCLVIYTLLLGVIFGRICPCFCQIGNGMCDCDRERFHVDLRNDRLTEVPTNISSRTQSLDLNRNRLRILRNDSFIRLKSLIILDLSKNLIEMLEPAAFRGLSELISLDLRENRLLLNYKAYPSLIFQPLRKLKMLSLFGNMKNVQSKTEIKEYPVKVFSHLNTLKTLCIDGLKDVRFGSGFLRMSQLTSLYLYYGALGNVLKLETIAVFLKLRIHFLSIACSNIEAGIFKPFKHLTNITIATYGLGQALEQFAGLENHKLWSVAIQRYNTAFQTAFVPQNFVLTKNNTAHLAAMCVTKLRLFRNYIIHVDVDVFAAFKHPECLEILDLRQNLFNVATHYFTFLTLARFPNLKSIKLSPARILQQRKRRSLSDETRFHNQASRVTQGLASFYLPLPPSIEFINASYLGVERGAIHPIVFVNGSNLRILDLAFFGNMDCSFHVAGLPNLAVLNISGFDCSHSVPNLFKTLWNLEVLTARECRLAESLQHATNGSFFPSLPRLRLLDLSDNNLIAIPRYLFQPLVSLEILILANNKLYQMPQSVFILVSLSYLDLSSNVLESITDKDVDHFNKLVLHSTKTLTLSLCQNPLLCTCNTLPFLHWFFTTNIYIGGNRSLKCTLKNGTVTKILNLKSEIKNMEVECVSKIWLKVSMVGCSLLVLSIVLGIFGYRYRWNIIYYFRTKWRKNSGYEELPMEQYQYDAFVAYNYHNYQWACIVLRRVLETENHYYLCLHDRDFPVGVSIQQNIVDAVNHSRKVILVINRAFLTSDWCEFEIQMAGMRMVRDGRDGAIIVIMMEEIPVAEMPRSLLNLWKNITFLLWTNDQIDEQIFWDRLLEVMARP